jgi:DNA-binding CsgD family transcriptional regulator
VIDPIALLEAAYAMDGSEEAWLSRLAQGARAGLANRSYVMGWTYDASGDDLHTIRSTACAGVDPSFFEENAAFDAALPHSVRRAISQIYRTGFVGTLRQAPAALKRSGLDAAQTRRFDGLLHGFMRARRMENALWVNAQDPTYLGCLLVAPLDSQRGLAPRETHQWRCVAAHVAAAFRVRRRILASTNPSTAEAVLRPDGKVEHTEGAAQSEPARAALRQAVRSVDRARGALRRHDPDEAVSIWHALVAGRWSLIDHIDSDGRRFVMAHKNDARVPDQRGLTLREQQVLAYAALGHSNKVIAYELGLSTSTVAGHLSRARAKATLPSLSALQVLGSVSAGSPDQSTK